MTAPSFVRLALHGKTEMTFEGRAISLDELVGVLSGLASKPLVLFACDDPDHRCFGYALGIINQAGLRIRGTRLMDFSDLLDADGALRDPAG
jgi:hypothetical protein